MRVAVDGRALRPGAVHGRGVARYLRCLLEALGELEPGDEYAVLVAGRGDPEGFAAPNVRLVRSRVPGRALWGAAALTGRPRLDRLAGACDVAWAPAVAPLAASRGVPLVLTLHDLSFEHEADFGRYERAWHRLARPLALARRAERVICPSRAVADAAAAWGAPAERLRVVRSGPGRPVASGDGGAASAGAAAGRSPHAAAGRPPHAAAGRPPHAAAAAPLPAGVSPPFVLAVGALEPRKLPLVLAEAHGLAQARGLRAPLVFAGDGPLRPELERTGATVLGYVPDGVLETLYAGALTVVCASRDEGFGFTPVEALARGVPPVVAELAVFDETLGEGALRVAPGDAEALADALLRLEREPGLRERLVAAGSEAIAGLSWERAARETRAVLAEAAASRPWPAAFRGPAGRLPARGRRLQARGRPQARSRRPQARSRRPQARSRRPQARGRPPARRRAVSAFAIVTVIHDSAADLERLLDSVERHLDPRPPVIVVDSGSRDRGPELARERRAVVTSLDGNRGFGAGCNAGLALVEAPVTALVNPDVELLDAGLARLAADAAEREALLAPRLLNRDGSVQDSAHPVPGRVEGLVPALLPRPLLPGPLRHRYEPWRSDRPREVGWAVAACLVARTDLLRRLGPFDPDAFLFYEDMELCLRGRRAGVPTILRPDVALRHLGGGSVGPALGTGDLPLRARRRREVMAQQGRRALLLDDLAEAATFATRAAARKLAGRGGDIEAARLRALSDARRAGREEPGA